MAYFCNFITKKQNGQEETWYGHACFQKIYTIVKSYEYIKVHVLKDCSGLTGNSMPFSKKDITDYHKLLVDAGFIVELDLNDKFIYNNKEYECYTFKIDCINNSTFVILYLLNVIRFLYEEDLPEIAKKVLEWKDEDTSFYNKMAIACYIQNNYMNSNHHFIPYYNLMKLMNSNDFLEYAKSKGNIPYLRDYMPKSNAAKRILIFKNKSFSKIFQHYSKITK